jgi:hypothetical protein
MWFINDSTVAFFISNYIALHNIHRETTNYVGVEKVVGEVTAFYSISNKKQLPLKCHPQGINLMHAETSEPIQTQTEGEDPRGAEETHLIAYAESPIERKEKTTEYPYAANDIKSDADGSTIDKILGVKEEI